MVNLTAQQEGCLLLAPNSHNYNHFVYQEKEEGFLWISSLNGWYRSDGSSFEYLPITGIGNSNQSVQSDVFPDQSNRLWFSTENALHYFDLGQQKYTTTHLLTTSGDTILDGYKLLYQEDKKIWLKAGSQIGFYDEDKEIFKPIPFRVNGVRFAVDTFENGVPKTIISCLWLYGNGFELLSRDSPNEKWKYQYIDTHNGNPLPAITGAIFAPKGQVYLSTKDGLAQFNTQKNNYNLLSSFGDTIFPLQGCLTIKQHPQKNSFYCSYLDTGIGVYAYDQNGQIIRNDCQFNRRVNTIDALNFSQNGKLWKSINGQGVMVCKEEKSAIERIDTTQFYIDIKQDQEGALFFLTSNGIVDKKSPYSAEWIRVSEGGQNSKYLRLLVTPSSVYAYSQYGINRIKKHGEQEESYFSFSHPLLDFIDIVAFRDEQLIINTNAGLFKLILANGNCEMHSFFNEETNEKFGYINLLSKDTIGLVKGETQLTTLNAFSAKHDLSSSIAVDNYILDFVKDQQHIWVGTTEGLYKVENGYSHFQGLLIPNATSIDIQKIIVYDANRLILNTSQGLIIYHHKTGKTHLFNEFKSTTEKQNIRGTGVVDPLGYCWTLTDVGLIKFHPDSLNLLTPKYAPYLNGLWINDLPYKEEIPLTQIDELCFEYWENSIDFKISFVDFDQPKQSMIKYRLIGYDSTYKYIPRGEFARFSQLYPGNYQLEMIAISGNLVEGPSKLIRIEIVPPLWQRTWFQILCLFVFAGTFLAINQIIVKRKLRKITAQLEREKAINDERNRIAAEVHDDLGGELAAISMMSETLLLLSDESTDGKIEITGIHEKSKKAIQDIREIIFALDARRSNLKDLVQLLDDFGNSLFTTKSIAFTIRMEIEQPDLVLTSGQKRNLNLMIKEALNNAYKYSQANGVILWIYREEQNLHFKVVDDGVGFDLSVSSKKISYGLENMQVRAISIGARAVLKSIPNEGTTVTFIWPIPINK